jgi:hypothetical protein
MTNTKTNPVVRLLPSMTDFAFLMPLLFIFAGMHGAKTLLGDGDTGWHIRTGEWIMSHHRVPDTDLYSFTRPGQPWFAWEWLWDVIFAWLHQHWGLAAVVIGGALIIGLTSALLFRLAYHKSGNPLAAMAVTFLAIAGSSIHFLARPHLFTLLFIVVFYSMLERVRESGATRLLWWLPVLTVLWTNLHGGWFVGIVLIGVYGAGDLAEGLFAARPGAFRMGFRRMLPYLACAMGCLAASLAGPYTYHLHVHIWQYLTDSFQREHIQEMLPINFLNPAARYFEVMWLAGSAACIWHLRRKRYTECLLVLLFAHLALVACRNIPIFGIAAAPVVALAVTEWLQKLEEGPVAKWLESMARALRAAAESLSSMEGIGRTHLVSALALVLLTAILYAPAPPPNFRARFDGETFPVKAFASLNAVAADGRMFTLDQWGDYLIYQNPNRRVFIDGRSDFYGSPFVQKYLDIINVSYKWQRYLDEYSVDTVMLPIDVPLTGALKESSRWRVVYDDGKAIIFRTGNRLEGSQVSAVNNGGKDRDRKITSNQPSDRTITKTKT